MKNQAGHQPGRAVFVYLTSGDTGTRQVVAIVAPAMVQEHGLRPEAILGAVPPPAETGHAPTIAPETFQPNQTFVQFLEILVRKHVGEVAGIRQQAAQVGDGNVYLIDGRTPDPGGTVPPQDIIGAVEVRGGVPTEGSYRHNPNHRLLTEHGFFLLPPELEAALGEAVAARYRPASGSADGGG